MNKYKKKYLLAFASSMAYSYWLIGSALAVLFTAGKYDYFSLFLIMFLSFIISIIVFRGINRISLLGFVSGIAFSIGNMFLYVLIGNINVVIAGSFTALNLVFFPLLIFRKGKKNLAKHLIGSSIIATGLVIESLTLGGLKTDFLLISIITGIFLGLIYAIATYFFNSSLIKEKDIKNTISTIFLTEVIFFGFAALAFNNFYTRIFSNVLFIINIFLISISIFAGIYLEAKGFKGLKVSEFEERNTVNILSNLELLPILIISIFQYTKYFSFYFCGLILIVLGMIIISLR